jgi:hypothetical protein
MARRGPMSSIRLDGAQLELVGLNVFDEFEPLDGLLQVRLVGIKSWSKSSFRPQRFT